MQVFRLDRNITVSAQYMSDMHIPKIATEAAQIVSAAVLTKLPYESADDLGLFKLSHPHHPLVKWAAKGYGNFLWLHAVVQSICDEWRFRRGPDKFTRAESVVNRAVELAENLFPNRSTLDDYPYCMPEQYCDDDIIASYRRYYAAEKRGYWRKTRFPGELMWVPATWGRRGKPEWMPDCTTP